MPFTVTIDRISFALGSCITLVMAGILMYFSSGWSLVVAHMPALAFAWAIFAHMYFRARRLPSAGEVIPVYFIAIAVYLIHFAEQFSTGFAASFAELYGARAYSAEQFVIFAMVSAALYTLSCLAVFLRCITFLMIPVLFFALDGIYGSAITQTWWSFEVKGYFPGLITSLINWFLGPVLIAVLLGSFRLAAGVMLLLGVAIIVTLSAF